MAYPEPYELAKFLSSVRKVLDGFKKQLNNNHIHHPDMDNVSRMDAVCLKMMARLGYNPLGLEYVEAIEALDDLINDNVANPIRDGLHLAKSRAMDAATALAVDGSMEEVVRKLCLEGLVQLNQPPGVDVKESIKKILVDTIK